MISRITRLGARAVPVLLKSSAQFRLTNPSTKLGVSSGLAFASAVAFACVSASAADLDYSDIRAKINKLLENNEDMGPTLVRLAWHSSGTYSKKEKNGGSEGARMRFAEEGSWDANNGLDSARALLDPIKQQYPELSYSDLWTLAGVTAIEYMGGPSIKWRPGRSDVDETAPSLTDGRLPDGGKDQSHLRDIFYRMGFNDKEIVALSGAHSLGRCHRENSGYEGPWTRAPTTFSNEYFRELVENNWTVKDWTGKKQFEDPTGDLMMLPTDMALMVDPVFRKYVEEYAKDEEAFFRDFSKAFEKLTELGVKNFNSGWFF